MEFGKPVIKITDTLRDAMPLSVSFNKKGSVIVGDSARTAERSDKLKAYKFGDVSATNTFSGFLRTIGTDIKYASSNINKEFSSEELIAECLKKARTFILDEELNSAVITVPSKFMINQKSAILNAAKLADFKQVELLHEPIAASMAYRFNSISKDGLWLVFDFNDYAFNASLLKIELGNISFIDTEGDNYLGSKNIDYAIVDEILIPHLQKNFSIESIINDDVKKVVLHDAMKHYAEEAKIQLWYKDSHNLLSGLGDIPGVDDEGNEFELDITISQTEMGKTVSPIFQKAITICNELLKRNHLSGNNLGTLILVGGPTYSPILRKMLKEQVTEKVDTSCDPMTVVAKGAALYASTIDSEIADDKQFEVSPINLQVEYEPTTVENEEFVIIKILKEKTEGTIHDKCFAELVRCDKGWSSGKIAIDENGEVLEVALNAGKMNRFEIKLYDNFGNRLPCYPIEFSIIHGQKVGSTTLPYSIGTEAKSKATGKIVFRTIKGLEKNQSLPAIGIINSLKTDKDIFPGDKSTFIKIPIYQGDYGAEGSRAIYNEHVFDILITGEYLPALLPAGSDIDISIKVDKSERIIISAFFPSLNYTIDIYVPNSQAKEIDLHRLFYILEKAKHQFRTIKQYLNWNEFSEIEKDIIQSESYINNAGNDYDKKKQALDYLRRVLRKLDDLQDAAEWPITEKGLKNAYYRLESAFKEFEGRNEERIKEAIAQFKEQIPQVIKDENIKAAKELEELTITMISTISNQNITKSIDVLKTLLVERLQDELISIAEFNAHFDFLYDLGNRINETSPTIEEMKRLDAIEKVLNYE